MSKASEYAAKFNKVFDYIDKNLDEELTLERLSQVACFSKYHFHRQFSAYTGIAVFKYVQLVRLKRASYRLVFNQQERITDIALDARFENPESFSRAFKNTFGQTPSEFRDNPAWQHWNEQYKFPIRERRNNMEVKIVNCEPVKVAMLKHYGPPDLVNDSVKIFIDWRKTSGLSPVKSSKSFGIVYDNPDTTAPDQFKFGICGSVTEDIPDNPQGVQNRVIPGGRCAVVRHHGSHDRIGESIYPLYREWLPKSGESLRDFPLYFHYLNLMPETAEHDLITDIYLPLK
ncbi:MAG: AraC family transcriptional regulator [Gallionellales bacterium 35-53-114]|jgi:AraC family transcriptional regulator|nr:MAG: AraC family transcriptional regulator [Gallionellales bacterium 35-53-114]OYZ63716.1 MAG: AraC family transcriptional regulator [Gallionellales bacterium 24-53-125]OZB09450.1 MAG: AraC family transcriptional regulator [Gallionellales bacterium 39-52-133]HQS57887.1 AraC family transcriptional regulator [Gallionellaceae bacterium]HQS76048.1 AraC family transcriptional regulator [Gallionellaceae bacterium]